MTCFFGRHNVLTNVRVVQIESPFERFDIRKFHSPNVPLIGLTDIGVESYGLNGTKLSLPRKQLKYAVSILQSKVS